MHDTPVKNSKGIVTGMDKPSYNHLSMQENALEHRLQEGRLLAYSNPDNKTKYPNEFKQAHASPPSYIDVDKRVIHTYNLERERFDNDLKRKTGFRRLMQNG